MGIFGGGIADKVRYEFQHIGVTSDIAERVIAVGAIRVHQVKYADGVPFPQQQRNGAPGQLPLRVRANIGGVGEIDIGLYHIARLA